MKKLLLIFIAINLLVIAISPCVSAGADSEGKTDEDFLNSVFYTCTYDAVKSQIVIEGTVKHDIMTAHKDYTIELYAIPPGEDYQIIINDENTVALSSASMAIKFTFNVDAVSMHERYSKYAVVFCSPEGERYLSGTPMLASVSSDHEYTYGDRTDFKGIHSNDSSVLFDSGAGTVIVDIDLSHIVGDVSNSILYPMGDTYIYINRSYILDIDKKVLSASVTNGKVYLRFLVNASDEKLATAPDKENNRLGIPNLYSEEALNIISAVSGFLAERYDGTNATNGHISGIILGSRIDDIENTNHIGELSVQEYADIYTLYLVVVANAVRSVNPETDMVIPLSDANDYSSSSALRKELRPSEFFEYIISQLDSSVSGDFDCTAMIEADTVPFDISCQNIEKGIDRTVPINEEKIYTQNISVFTSYVEKLARKYQSAPSNIIYMWNVPSDLKGNALCCAYAYSYYKLMSYAKISSFVVSFEGSDSNGFSDVSNILKYIDTDKGISKTRNILKYFEENTWNDVIGGTVNNKKLRSLIETQAFTQIPVGIVGEFNYIDFSVSSTLNMMAGGKNCLLITSEHDINGDRAVKISSAKMKLGDRLECIGVFDYPESYRYTPFLGITLSIDGGSDESLYEVTLTLGEGRNRISAAGVVTSGEKTILMFDASAYSSDYMADHFSISVRCLDSDADGVSVWLHDFKGYSTKYVSEELDRLVEEQRQQIRKQNSDEDGVASYSVIVTVIGIAFAFIAIGVAFLIIFRKEEVQSKGE